jgi:hypothetical protein
MSLTNLIQGCAVYLLFSICTKMRTSVTFQSDWEGRRGVLMTKSDAKPGNRLPAELKKSPTGIIGNLSDTERGADGTEHTK